MFMYEDADDTTPEFTTLRNADVFTEEGEFTFAGGAADRVRASFVTTDVLDSEALLLEIEARIELGNRFEVLGFGVNGAEGSVVNSLTTRGDTFFFGTGDSLPGQPGDDDAEDDDDSPQDPTRPVSVETGR